MAVSDTGTSSPVCILLDATRQITCKDYANARVLRCIEHHRISDLVVFLQCHPQHAFPQLLLQHLWVLALTRHASCCYEVRQSMLFLSAGPMTKAAKPAGSEATGGTRMTISPSMDHISVRSESVDSLASLDAMHETDSLMPRRPMILPR